MVHTSLWLWVKSRVCSQPEEETIEISPIQCQEILQEMRDAAPMNKLNIAKKFLGLYVHWDGLFYTAWDYGAGMTLLRVGLVTSPLWFFEFMVDPTKYPILNSLERDASLRVQGRIKHVEHASVTLENVVLYFPIDE